VKARVVTEWQRPFATLLTAQVQCVQPVRSPMRSGARKRRCLQGTLKPGGPIREINLRGSYEFDGHAGTIEAGSGRPPLLPRRGAYLVSPFQWCAPRSVPKLRIQDPKV
jgi:hypothetical protein